MVEVIVCLLPRLDKRCSSQSPPLSLSILLRRRKPALSGAALQTYTCDEEWAFGQHSYEVLLRLQKPYSQSSLQMTTVLAATS
jgi:hypothetical protein